MEERSRAGCHQKVALHDTSFHSTLDQLSPSSRGPRITFLAPGIWVFGGCSKTHMSKQALHGSCNTSLLEVHAHLRCRTYQLHNLIAPSFRHTPDNRRVMQNAVGMAACRSPASLTTRKSERNNFEVCACACAPALMPDPSCHKAHLGSQGPSFATHRGKRDPTRSTRAFSYVASKSPPFVPKKAIAGTKCSVYLRRACSASYHGETAAAPCLANLHVHDTTWRP